MEVEVTNGLGDDDGTGRDWLRYCHVGNTIKSHVNSPHHHHTICSDMANNTNMLCSFYTWSSLLFLGQVKDHLAQLREQNKLHPRVTGRARSTASTMSYTSHDEVCSDNRHHTLATYQRAYE
jgi:hypothetical protein